MDNEQELQELLQHIGPGREETCLRLRFLDWRHADGEHPSRRSNPSCLLVTLPDPDYASQVRRLLRTQIPGCEVVGEPRDCRQSALCRWLQALPPRQVGEVQAVLSEAVAVLEHSRQAFKSAQLAALRRRLSQLLKELSGTDESGTS